MCLLECVSNPQFPQNKSRELRQEHYKARTSQTQTQTLAPKFYQVVHKELAGESIFLAIVTSTTTIEVPGTNSPLPSYHSILPPTKRRENPGTHPQLTDTRATMKAPSASKADGARGARDSR